MCGHLSAPAIRDGIDPVTRPALSGSPGPANSAPIATCLAAIGIGMLFRAGRETRDGRAGRSLLAAMLGGWGIINLTEGLIDHHLLGIHHVLPGHPNQFLFDLLFPGSGVLLISVGVFLARGGPSEDARAHQPGATYTR